jgi:hypothetical protein
MIGAMTGTGIYEVTVSKLHSAVFFFFGAVYVSSGLTYL